MSSAFPKSQFTISLSGIYLVWRRHALRYRSSWKVNCIPPISEPLMYLIAFGYGMSPLVGDVQYQGESVPYFNFIAPGMIAVGVLFQSFFEGAFGTYLRIRYQLNWQSLLTAPISYAEIFLGDFAWATTRGTIAGVLTALTAVVLGVYPLSAAVACLPLIVLGSALFASLGLIAASMVNSVDQLNVPLFLLIIPMFVFCGTYFPRETLPDALEFIASLLPLAALVDLFRWPLAVPPNWVGLIALLICWMLCAGFIAMLRLRRKLFA